MVKPLSSEPNPQTISVGIDAEVLKPEPGRKGVCTGQACKCCTCCSRCQCCCSKKAVWVWSTLIIAIVVALCCVFLIKATVDTKFRQSGASRRRRQLSAGISTATGLTELKYVVTSISVCTSLSISGTAFQSNGKCLDLYSHQVGPSDTRSETLAQVQAIPDSEFTNFMDAADLEQLKRSVGATALSIGEYHWGTMNWHSYMSMKGTVRTTDGIDYYTKEVDAAGHASTSLLTGPAESAWVSTGNGGTWFKFQKPFVITSGMVANQQSIAMDLSFNPEGMVTAGDVGSPFVVTDPSGNKGFTMPVLAVLPVPHLATETVSRESYIIDSPFLNNAGQADKVLLELYYITQDATKSVYAVDTKGLLGNYTVTLMGIPKVAYVTEQPTGYAFQDWQLINVIKDFTRLTTVGATGWCQFHASASGDYYGTETRGTSYVLDEILELV